MPFEVWVLVGLSFEYDLLNMSRSSSSPFKEIILFSNSLLVSNKTIFKVSLVNINLGSESFI